MSATRAVLWLLGLSSVLICWGCSRSAEVPPPASAESLRQATAWQQEGEELLQRSSYAEAQRRFADAYEARRARLGTEHSESVASLRGLATAHFREQKNPQETLKWLLELRTASTKLYRGEVRSEQVLLHRMLAKTYDQLGWKPEAEAAMDAALKEYERVEAAGISQDTAKNRIGSPRMVGPAMPELPPAIRQQLSGDIINNPALKAAMEFNLDAQLALTQNPESGLQTQNEVRKLITEFQKQDPEAFKLLGGAGPATSPTRRDPQSWFDREWEIWNKIFERGMPFEIMLQQKGSSGPFEAVPSEAEEDPLVMAKLALGLKGLLLDRELRTQAALRNSTEPWLNEWRARLLAAQSEANSLKPGTAQWAASFAQGWKLKNELRREITARPGYERPPCPTAEAVGNHLPAGSVLVEFLRYGRDPGGYQPIEARYGAVVIAKDRRPVWIPLPTAEVIEKLVKEYQQLMRSGEPGTSSEWQKRDQETRALLTSLHDALWRPLEPALPGGTKSVLISPDAALHVVSFATLLKQDRFLGQDYLVTCVTGGRDLLRSPQRSDNRRMEIWANPSFDQRPEMLKPNGPGIGGLLDWLFAKRPDEGGFFAHTLRPLEGAAKEARMLKAVAAEKGTEAVVHTDADASESGLKQLRSPYVLHLATHGLFAFNSQAGEGGGLGVPARARTPNSRIFSMERSGLALAGANQTIGARSRGERVSTEADGILNAAEAASLKLDKTWLVVMSACDTGVGNTINGEDALTLKRGFVQAGTANVLFSLWRVNDDYAVQFMEKFYRAALANGNAPQTLAALQAGELAKAEGSLWTRVKNAGPFVMNSVGTGH